MQIGTSVTSPFGFTLPFTTTDQEFRVDQVGGPASDSVIIDMVAPTIEITSPMTGSTALPSTTVPIVFTGVPTANIYRRGLPNGSEVLVASNVASPYGFVVPSATIDQKVIVRSIDGASQDSIVLDVLPAISITNVTPSPALPLQMVTVTWSSTLPMGTSYRLQRNGFAAPASGGWVTLVTTTSLGATFTVPNSTTDQRLRVITSTGTNVSDEVLLVVN